MNAQKPVTLDPLAALEQAAALALEGDAAGPNPDGPATDLAPQIEQVKICLQMVERVWSEPGAAPGHRTDDEFPTHPEGVAGEEFEPPFRVPGYQILAEISRGGMGIVYRAGS